MPYSKRQLVIGFISLVTILAGFRFVEAQFISPTCVPPNCNPQVIQNIPLADPAQTADFNITGDGGVGTELQVGTEDPTLSSSTDNLIYGNVGGGSSAGSLLLLQRGGVDRFKVEVDGDGFFTGSVDVQGGNITNTTGGLSISSSTGNDIFLVAPGAGNVSLGFGDNLTVPGDLTVDGTINGDGSGLTGLSESDTFATVVARGSDSGGDVTVSGNMSFDASTRSIRRASTPIMTMTGGETVVNEQGVNRDFRVEGTSNANAFFVEGSGGNVGIGTAAPLAALQVCNSGGSSCSYGVYGATEDWYLRSGNTSTGKVILQDTGGNVGIGTASPGQIYKLDVNGAIRASSSLVGTMHNATASGSAASPAFFFNSDPNVGIYHVASDALGFTTGGVNRMTIDNSSVAVTDDLTVAGQSVCRADGTNCPSLGVSGSGTTNSIPKWTAADTLSDTTLMIEQNYANPSFGVHPTIGIGESSPQYMIDAGNAGWEWPSVARFANSDGSGYEAAVSIESGSSGEASIAFSHPASFARGKINYDHATGDLEFRSANGTDGMVIDLNNDVTFTNDVEVNDGLTVGGTDVCLSDGTNCPPSDVFSVTGSGAGISVSPTTGAVVVQNTGDTDATDDITGSGTVNYIPKFSGAQTVANSTIYESGSNVGLGTASPNFKLSLGSDLAATKLALYETGGTNAYGLGVVAGAMTLHLNGSSARFAFLDDETSGTELFTINGNGSVSATQGSVSVCDGSCGILNYATGAGDLYIEDALEVDGDIYPNYLNWAGASGGYSSSDRWMRAPSYIELKGNSSTYGLIVRAYDSSNYINLESGASYGSLGYNTSGGAMYFNASGDTGMGATPYSNTKLYVYDGTYGYAYIGRDGTSNTNGKGIMAYGSYYGGYFRDTNSSATAYAGYGDYALWGGGTTYGIQAYGTTLGGYFYDSSAGGAWGYVGYGSSWGFYTADGAAKSGGGSWSVYSDRRLKKDIRSFDDGLETVRKLEPVSFTWNGLADSNEGETGISFIAQDVEDEIPYMIEKFSRKLHPDDAEETELFMLNPSSLPFVNLNAIKDLDIKIEDMEMKITEIEEVKDDVEVLEEKVKELEERLRELEEQL